MKFFLSAMGLQMRRLLRQAAIVACLLLLPALVAALGVFAGPSARPATLQVGVFIPAGSEKGERIWDLLDNAADEQTLFVRAESEEQVEEMVAARVWECGYLFAPGLDASLEQGNYRRIITRVMSPASLSMFSEWVVSSAVFEVCVPHIALSYLQEQGVIGPQTPEGLPPYADNLYGPDRVMTLEVQPVFGAAADASSAAGTGATLARGAIALLLFLISCLCAVRYRDDLSSGFFRRLGPYAHPLRLYFASWLSSGILSAVAGAAALALAAVFFPAQFASFPAEAAMLLLYLFCLAGASYLLASLFHRRENLIALLPFLAISCLLLSPILFDLGQWFAPARPLSLLLPPTPYLRAAAGNPAGLWQMALGGCLYFAAGAGVARLRQRRARPG